ncbi:MAG: hypothetical protein OES57_06555 [Acidimicrobiia bacterium]|nr:hypothetical protein [Acidimicrobiia bacterium]
MGRCVDPAATVAVDVFALADAPEASVWFHDRQGPPDSLHATVSNSNPGVIDDYVEALRASVDQLVGTTTDDRSSNYATLE